MLTRLHGHARFKNTPETMTVDFQPIRGITAVVGPNGVGKTFVASEALRYVFFGSKALRAPLSTIEELDLTADVRIRDVPYTVARSLKTATISSETGVLAVGAEEVTKKVTELLGYGLDIFDVCNCSMQGETASLGSLTPGKRRELLDRLFRINDLRALEKDCRDESNRRQSIVAGLRRGLLPDVPEPVKPDGYVPSEELRRAFNEAQGIEQDRRTLQSQLREPRWPVAPSDPRPDPLALVASEQRAEQWQAERDKRRDLQRIADLELVDTDEATIAAGEAAYAWEEDQRRRGPAPSLTREEIDTAMDTWQEINRLKNSEDDEVECPKCHHQFHRLPPVPAEPTHSMAALREEQNRIVLWEANGPPLPKPSPFVASLTPSSAARLRDGLAKNQSILDARAALSSLPTLEEDPQAEHIALLRLTDAWQNYDKAFDVAQHEQQVFDRVSAELSALPAAVDLSSLANQMVTASDYENRMAVVSDRKAHNSKITTELDKEDALVKAFLQGSKTVAEAREETLGFLMPALSNEASSLLFDMTNGKLSSLIIDEDAAITVGGKPLETLSGAGKTVASLALRVALAKLVTGSTFPVFIGDEMDGDLDKLRREATAQAMVSLKTVIEQIVLITHRDVDIADHVVTLGE